MSNEEKKEKPENVTSENSGAKETPKEEPKKAAPLPAEASDKKKGGAITKRDRPKECANCNKSIKKKWHYRNGKFYCSPSCWKKSKKKAQEGTQKPADKK